MPPAVAHGWMVGVLRHFKH